MKNNAAQLLRSMFEEYIRTGGNLEVKVDLSDKVARPVIRCRLISKIDDIVMHPEFEKGEPFSFNEFISTVFDYLENDGIESVVYQDIKGNYIAPVHCTCYTEADGVHLYSMTVGTKLAGKPWPPMPWLLLEVE